MRRQQHWSSQSQLFASTPFANNAARVVVYGLHAVCAVYFVIAGLLYRFVQDAWLANFLSLYELTVSTRQFYRIAIVHFVFAGVHAIGVLRAFSIALRARWREKNTDKTRRRRSSATRRSWSDRLSTIPGSRGVVWIYDAVLSPRGVLGVQGHLFDTFFLIRELAETVLQSIQAYQMSHRVPRSLLNRTFVALLVINCWSSTIMHHVSRRQMTQRFLCVISDVILDFVASIGIPVVLALSYIPDYDTAWGGFRYELLYDDAWLVSFINESSIMMFGSWMDAFSRLTFSIGLLISIEDLKGMLQLQRAGVVRRRAANAFSQIAPASNVQRANVEVAALQRRSRFIRFAHRLLAVYGTIVLVVHLYAESRVYPRSCVLNVRPWLVAQPACAFMELKCGSSDLKSGDAIEQELILSAIHSSTLVHIAIRHCSAVVFSPAVQRFRHLLGLKVYNSSVLAWPTEAALHEEFHPKMRFMFFGRVVFANNSLPAALATQSLPSSIVDIEFSATNLNGLPEDLHLFWPKGPLLSFEFGQLDHVPLTLVSMSLHDLVLGGNPIRHVDPGAFMIHGLTWLKLSDTPLERLPEIDKEKVAAVGIGWIDLFGSRLEALPEWMDEEFLTTHKVSAGNSPLCIRLQENTVLLKSEPRLSYLDCSTAQTLKWVYPIDYEVNLDAAASKQ
ncbi:hypothetical protein PINS_up006748 [Pythium insidiosum]|nr:hypothetical protein PINS_up006748 [Pythium insidiosum]